MTTEIKFPFIKDGGRVLQFKNMRNRCSNLQMIASPSVSSHPTYVEGMLVLEIWRVLLVKISVWIFE